MLQKCEKYADTLCKSHIRPNGQKLQVMKIAPQPTSMPKTIQYEKLIERRRIRHPYIHLSQHIESTVQYFIYIRIVINDSVVVFAGFLNIGQNIIASLWLMKALPEVKQKFAVFLNFERKTFTNNIL
ncbi:hypothetical protein GQX74_015367 [Glossina fuscipes]|nr:hypothetical protein GQX74_015367 [Glossina fuscipes]